jgi:glutamate synthase domain-containing protein 2
MGTRAMSVIKTPARTEEKMIPAQFKTVTKQVEKAPAKTVEEAVAAEYKTVTRQVMKAPATVKEEVIPAEFKTVTRKVITTPASTREIEIPAEYTTLTKRRLVKQGGFTDWREVVCESAMTSELVRQVQVALKGKGYDPGPIDNIMGPLTKAALVKYQTDNKLPVGSLDKETMKTLGVAY